MSLCHWSTILWLPLVVHAAAAPGFVPFQHGAALRRGRRIYNEDAMASSCLHAPSRDKVPCHRTGCVDAQLFGVYDGHTTASPYVRAGNRASEFVSRKLDRCA